MFRVDRMLRLLMLRIRRRPTPVQWGRLGEYFSETINSYEFSNSMGQNFKQTDQYHLGQHCVTSHCNPILSDH